jgi:O-antigen ligase
MISYLSKLSSQNYLQYLMFALITYFLSIQAWNQSPTTNAAILTWVTGLILWIVKRDTGLTGNQKKIVFASCFVFFTCLLSWLFSDHELAIKKLEPDTRFLLFGLTIIAVSSSKLSMNQLFAGLIIAGISYGCSGLYERHILGVYKVNGDENAVTFGNGAFLIAACLMMIYLTKVHVILKIIAPVAIIFALIAAVYSGTRGSFLALAPLALIIVGKFNNKGRAVSFVFVLIAVYAIVNLTNIPESFTRAKNNFIAYYEEDRVATSTGARLEMWNASLCIFKESPILGAGPRAFRNANNDENHNCDYPEVKQFNQAHSIIFNTLATKGIIGLISLIIFFSTLVYFSFKERSPARFLLLGAVVTMLSYGLTVDLLFKVFVADKHLILLAIIIGMSRKDS